MGPTPRRWDEEFRFLSGSTEQLGASDWERLAVAAYMIGEDDSSAAAWEAAHHRYLEAGDGPEAARCSFWLALGLMMRGHMAQANGWLRRTQTIVEGGPVDCTAAGYLLIPALLGELGAGNPGSARDMAVEAFSIGARLGDPDLRAIGTLCHGQALLALGQIDAGMAKLDEVMVSVTAGEVGPIASGIVYCAVILECVHLLDLARAAEWTAALSAWCDSQPGLVPYRGQCLVHRAQLQQAAGDWPDAAATADAACRRLADPPHPALGLAYYQQGELHRLRGAFDEAEASYRRANHAGYQPVPGLALLGLARGDAGAAATTIRRALHERSAAHKRTALLAAAVDIFRATTDVAAARNAADELVAIAADSTSLVLKAFSDHAAGTVLLAEGDPPAALRHLRAAAGTWRDVRMPYEAARTSVMIALCCAALGDRTSASLELDTARETFTRLGAHPDVAKVESLAAGVQDRSSNPLSPREREGAHIEWHVADAASLPLPDASYDVVLCQMGLMFMEDRTAALAEMRRVLTPGGRIALNTPGKIQPVFEVMEEAIVGHISPELGGFVRAVFSIHDSDTLASLLRAGGFENVTADVYRATLRLPSPVEFLWQYINLTPMGPFVAQAPEEAQAAMERQAVERWQPYTVDGRLRVEQPMVVAAGRR